jgi:hypothetical protein
MRMAGSQARRLNQSAQRKMRLHVAVCLLRQPAPGFDPARPSGHGQLPSRTYLSGMLIAAATNLWLQLWLLVGGYCCVAE